MEGNEKDRRLCHSQRGRGCVPGGSRYRLFPTSGDSEGPGQDRAAETTRHVERRVSGVPKRNRRPHRGTEVTSGTRQQAMGNRKKFRIANFGLTTPLPSPFGRGLG